MPFDHDPTIDRIEAALAKLAQMPFDTAILQARLRHELTLRLAREYPAAAREPALRRISDARQDYAPLGRA